MCQKVNFDRQKTLGLLQPLPILDRPWDSIAMDFIFNLPKTPRGKDIIWTIIDWFSKRRLGGKNAYLLLCFLPNCC